MNDNTKSATKVILVFLMIVIFFVGGFYLGRADLNNTNSLPQDASYQITGDIKQSRGSVNVNLLWEVWALIEKEYINKQIDGQALFFGAVKGLVSGLDDPYTAFLTPEESKDYASSNKGEFEGIGTTLRPEGEFVVVESPVDGSPAQKAGLEPGDVVLEVNGEDMQGVSVFEVASKIRGQAGTEVKIALFRPNTGSRYEVNITRQKIDIDNISVTDAGDGIYKIKIFKFTEETVEAFNAQWDRAVQKVIDGNARAVVIDLRNNPGGYVSSVEYVLGEFLPKGSLIFSEEDRDGNRVEHKVNRDGKLLNISLNVIVNQGSASASEIFAGAIQDHDRGSIIGKETVGKGVEQRLIQLSDGSLLQLVFQKWLTPDGRNISKDEPIKPDQEIDDYQQQENEALNQLKTKI